MAFGIQEPADGFQPTSTNRIQTIDNNAEERVLVPQPSESPRDPLNWSRIKKELCFLTILLGSFATGSLGPLFVPGFAVLAAHFDVPLTSITLLNGSLVMALGVSAYLCACFAAVFGKRIVYLITTTILVVTCCWAAASKSYTSLLVSRVFQGEKLIPLPLYTVTVKLIIHHNRHGNGRLLRPCRHSLAKRSLLCPRTWFPRRPLELWRHCVRQPHTRD